MKKILYLLLCILVFVAFESCHRDDDETNIDVSVITDIQENAITFLNNQCSSGQNFETAVNNCIQQLMQNQEVESAFVQDEKQVVVKYKSGVTGVIFFIKDGEEQKKLEKNPINTNSFNHITKGEIDNLAIIENHKVLIWDPWGRGPESDAVESIFNNCSDITFNVTRISGTSCTMQSLHNLTKYGFVYIDTHGGCFDDLGNRCRWILTKDAVNPAPGVSIDDLKRGNILIVTCGKIKNEYLNGQEIVIISLEGNWFAVTSDYISKYVSGSFDVPSIVFVSACYSFVDFSFANVFVGEKKASVYLGYDNEVSWDFAENIGKKFVSNMINEKLDALSACYDLKSEVDTASAYAVLTVSNVENPTYFPTGYVECPTLNKRWKLTDVFYRPDPYLGTTHFSQLQLQGSDFHIVYRLSKKNEMANGTYTPYVINDIGADTLWGNYYYSNSMHFLTGTYSAFNNSTFWRAPETHTRRIVEDAGQLKHQKQNGVDKLTFDFTGDDGYSYHGAFVGEIHQ